MEYTGYTILDDSEMADFYSGDLDLSSFKENQYLFLHDEVYCIQNQFARRVKYNTINNKWCNTIKPLDLQQTAAIDMLQDRTTKVKLICSVFGAGKDYLMFNQALSLIEEGVFKQIVYIRPNLTLANVPQIGYLPNDVDHKLAWTLAPLYDKVGGEEGVQMLVENGRLEMVPLLFIRGRSFEDTLVYVTEAQNIDTEIAKVIISRIGNGSELWMNGDYHNQTDSKLFDKDNGLVKMIDRLSGNKLFSYIYMPTSHRSDVASLANLLD